MINKQEQRNGDQTPVIGQSWPMLIINLSETGRSGGPDACFPISPLCQPLVRCVIHTRTSSPNQHQFLLTNQETVLSAEVFSKQELDDGSYNKKTICPGLLGDNCSHKNIPCIVYTF